MKTSSAARLNADWQASEEAVLLAGRLTPEDFAALLIGRRLDGDGTFLTT